MVVTGNNLTQNMGGSLIVTHPDHCFAAGEFYQAQSCGGFNFCNHQFDLPAVFGFQMISAGSPAGLHGKPREQLHSGVAMDWTELQPDLFHLLHYRLSNAVIEKTCDADAKLPAARPGKILQYHRGISRKSLPDSGKAAGDILPCGTVNDKAVHHACKPLGKDVGKLTLPPEHQW